MNGFLGSAILETAIGTAFLYLLLAVFCTAAVEWVATLLEARANTLRETIEQLLGDQELAAGVSLIGAFYRHPMISTLIKDGEHQSYLSPQAFGTAILDLAQSAKEWPDELPAGSVRTSLLALMRRCKGDPDLLHRGVEAWFNDAMRTASASYRKRTTAWAFGFAFAITIATNADTFVILGQPGRLPGWSSAAFHLTVWAWIARLTGWAVTTGAVSLGAPFWFGVLSRFVNLRPSEKSSPK